MNLLSLLASAAATAPQGSTEFVGWQGALQLMGIGMITVFIVLMLVIYLGKGLIAFVNKFVPEEEPAAQASPVAAAPASVDALTADIIAKAVNTLTNGKGKVESIKKI